jgi:DNA-binding winged helix-turn-helix (wHTH) protein/TolB-like protein/Tfp pilus assembly protein PilF
VLILGVLLAAKSCRSKKAYKIRGTALATFTDLRKGFELGPWQVLPDLGVLRQGETEQRLEPMVMNVLVLLASGDGDVVTADQIVEVVWGGRSTTPETIVQKIKVLREKLGDDPKDPKFIQTIPKIGYRVVCDVLVPQAVEAEPAPSFIPAYLWPIVGGFMAIAVIAFVVLGNRSGNLQRLESVNSVAVCPFENLSTEADDAFVFGFRQQLISTLSREPDLSIIKASCGSAKPVGDEVFDTIVTGSVQRAGGRVRITAILEASDGEILWSESIDGASEEVEEVFGLHERVANRVRIAILGESESEITASSRPVNVEAWDLYLLGDFAFSKRSESELNRAVDFFQRAIELDPKYGPAYLGLAKSFLLLADYPSTDVQAMYEMALETANEGAAMDPGVRDAVGSVYGFVDTKRFNWAEAASAFETAINSATVYPTSHHWYSRFLANVGLLVQSLEQAKIAQQLDTASPILNARLGVAYHWLNDSVNADKYYSRAADQEVGSWIHNLSYSLFLMQEQRFDEARQKLKEALISYGQTTAWVDPVFEGFSNPAEAESMAGTIASISAAAASGAIPTNIELTLWALLGQGDKAMQAAWALKESGDYFELEIFFLDEFRVLREHAEFPELLKTLGLPDYWHSIGCRWDGDRVICDPDSET